MKNKNYKGFSLVELLIVVAIIGIVAALAIPALQKGIRAAENGKTFSAMRTIATTQMGFFSQNSRFGRLSEINATLSQGIGTTSGDQLNYGKFIFEMVPATPTDFELKNSYIIKATRNVTGEGLIYQYEITEAGDIRQIFPAPAPTP